MNPGFQHLMQEATRLTRAGDLQAATAAIQAALRGGPVEAKAPPGNADWVIDVEARVVPDAPPLRFPALDMPAGIELPTPVREPQVDGRFIAGSYADGAGRRDYKLFIPPGAGERPLPLVVMLHGCTQDPDDFALGTAMNEAARGQGFFVLYPSQSRRSNPQRCWNWFKHNHQRRGHGEPALIAGMTRDVMAHHMIDSRRVYVAGLSAGGAMAAILGDAYPDLYAAVGVHSGLAAGIAKDLPSALAAMKDGGGKEPQCPQWRAHHRLSRRCRCHRASAQRRAGHCRQRGPRAGGGTRAGAAPSQAPLHATGSPRSRWARDCRALGGAWCATRVVGWQRKGVVHRCARP